MKSKILSGALALAFNFNVACADPQLKSQTQDEIILKAIQSAQDLYKASSQEFHQACQEINQFALKLKIGSNQGFTETLNFLKSELQQASKLKNYWNAPERMSDEVMLQGLGLFLFPLKIEAAKDVRRQYEKKDLSPESAPELFQRDVERRQKEYLFRFLQEIENRQRLARQRSFELA